MDKKVFAIEYSNKDNSVKTDTKLLLDAISEELNVQTEVIFYDCKKANELKEYLVQNAFLVLNRVNLGSLKKIDEYFQFLKDIANEQISVFTHPDIMINLDFKDILAKIKDTPLGEKSTQFYHTFEEFTQNFPPTLRSEKSRVLKANHGSTGEGVYLVSFDETKQTVECIEAVDNTKSTFVSIYDFLKFFEAKFEKQSANEPYFKGKSGFVSCKYLFRISEGELRVLLVRDRAIAVVNKIPKKGEYSASLSAGAKYIYENPAQEKWRELVEFTLDGLDYLEPYCIDGEFPLLWSMDFILDIDERGKDRYVLSEINCSSVRINSDLKYAKDIALALKES